VFSSNVVQLRGVSFSPEGRFSIVYEFITGDNLYNLLKKQDFTKTQLIEILTGTAAGMLHLHKERICHRDLAARNILIDLKDLKPKISDFGLSRLQVSDSSVTNSNVGPIKWMSPEALLEREYSLAGDVWSFGVVIFEVCL